MTSMEKQVMLRLCAKILKETDLYDNDTEIKNLIEWVCLSEQIKTNNNEIREMIGKYNQIEPKCREGVKDSLIRRKVLSEERNALYEIQNELKGQKRKIESTIEQ